MTIPKAHHPCPRSLAIGLVAFLAALAGCLPPGFEDGGESFAGTETGDTSITGDGDGEPGDGEPGDGDGDGDGDAVECGNAAIDPGEQCDDGNLIDGDGCSLECVLELGAVPCGNAIYECGDTVDNDMDGLADLADTNCTTPCDDDENSLQTLPGQDGDCEVDCFWNLGADACSWNLLCDPDNPGADIGCEYDSGFNDCDPAQSQECLASCLPLTPNACDCFGCCQVDGLFIYLGSNPECSMEDINACNTCTYFYGCTNDCIKDNCELCFGETLEDLPPECDGPSCNGGTPCDEQSDCVIGDFCQTGCCIPVVPG